MGRAVIGESGADRAADKMDKFISRSRSKASKMPTLLQQFQEMYPETWRQEIEKTRDEVKPWDPEWKPQEWGQPKKKKS